jgi:hypothetical protein
VCGTLRRVSRAFGAAARRAAAFARLDLAGARLLEDRWALLFVRSTDLSGVVRADLSGCARLGPDGWAGLAGALRGGALAELVLPGCAGLTDASLAQLVAAAGRCTPAPCGGPVHPCPAAGLFLGSDSLGTPRTVAPLCAPREFVGGGGGGGVTVAGGRGLRALDVSGCAKLSSQHVTAPLPPHPLSVLPVAYCPVCCSY